jgi:uncharacterized protein YjaG (DUF416 family)
MIGVYMFAGKQQKKTTQSLQSIHYIDCNDCKNMYPNYGQFVLALL